MDRTALLKARKLSSETPVHFPLPAQPINSRVTLVLENSPELVEIVLHDRARSVTWQIQMQKVDDHSYADVLLPNKPAMLFYHFELPNGRIIQERRQIERLSSPNRPIYGALEDHDFQIAVYDPHMHRPSWAEGMVVYLIFPDHFARSGTETPPRPYETYGQQPTIKEWHAEPEHPPRGWDFFGGNICGIIERLDYLVDLGVDCICLCPVFEAFSNHLYDTFDYSNIDPMLGTEADMLELIGQAHDRGVAIILDAVFNHCSCDSRYFDMPGRYSGIGKTSLAAALCYDPEIQAVFPDGLIWIAVGREVHSVVDLIRQVGTALGDPQSPYSSEPVALARLRDLLFGHAVLLVLDDVWESSVKYVEPFLAQGKLCHVLITARDGQIADKLGAVLEVPELKLNVMDEPQALKLLRDLWGGNDPALPQIAQRVGYLPLALKIAGSMLSQGYLTGGEWLETLTHISQMRETPPPATSMDTSRSGMWLQGSWVLSVETTRLYHPDSCLYTDDTGAELLVEGLGLPFRSVSTALNTLEGYDSGWLSLGKMLAYRAQTEPFIHLDYDVFLWRPLPPRLTIAPVFAQNPESVHIMYSDCYMPRVMEQAIAMEQQRSYLCALRCPRGDQRRVYISQQVRALRADRFHRATERSYRSIARQIVDARLAAAHTVTPLAFFSIRARTRRPTRPRPHSRTT